MIYPYYNAILGVKGDTGEPGVPGVRGQRGLVGKMYLHDICLPIESLY